MCVPTTEMYHNYCHAVEALFKLAPNEAHACMVVVLIAMSQWLAHYGGHVRCQLWARDWLNPYACDPKIDQKRDFSVHTVL